MHYRRYVDGTFEDGPDFVRFAATADVIDLFGGTHSTVKPTCWEIAMQSATKQ